MGQGHSTVHETGMNKVWTAALDKNNVEFVMLDLDSDGDVVEFLHLHPKWSVDFQDEEVVIFARAV